MLMVRKRADNPVHYTPYATNSNDNDDDDDDDDNDDDDDDDDF